MNIWERLKREREEYAAKLAEVDADIATHEGITKAPAADEIPLKQFLDGGSAETDWLINGVLARGTIAMLAADPRLGKTTLMVQSSLCLSVGQSPFEGWGVPHRARTLYLIAEGSRAPFRARVNTARIAKNIPREAEWFIQREDFVDFQIGSRGLESIVSHSRADLVVMDTMQYFFKGDENSSTDWMERVVKPLRILTGRYGCTFLLVHHCRKGTTSADDPMSRPRGTSAIGGTLDALFLLDRADGGDGTDRLLTMGKQKYAVEDCWSLRFDAANARFG